MSSTKGKTVPSWTITASGTGSARSPGLVRLVERQGLEVDAEQRLRAVEQSLAQLRVEALVVLLADPRADERLHRPAGPAGGEGGLERLLELRPDIPRPLSEQGRDEGLVQDGRPQELGAPQRELERDGSAGAAPEDRRRGEAQRLDQAGGIVGLLARRRRGPSLRSQAPRVAAPVVGDDRELVGEPLREGLERARIGRGSADEDEAATASPDLAVELRAVHRHEPSPNANRLSHRLDLRTNAGSRRTIRREQRVVQAPRLRRVGAAPRSRRVAADEAAVVGVAACQLGRHADDVPVGGRSCPG